MLNLQKGDKAVDATLGDGGHATEMIRKIGPEGTFIGMDVDRIAIEGFERHGHGRQLKCYLLNDNFAKLNEALDEIRIDEVDAIIADLGWRSEQIEDKRYGLSFQNEGPLDMRLGEKMGDLTAEEIINDWTEEKLTEIFYRYGEERYAKKIAKEIVKIRGGRRITTTTDLAQIVARAIPKQNSYVRYKINPATKIFQALRIVVNQELENLERFLPQALSRLKKGGRLAVITFHSLEDRIVKQFFRSNAGGCVCPKELPVCVCGKKPNCRIITKRPITASLQEIELNPRSRSAKLRVIEKI